MVQNQYSKQIIYTTKLVNKKFLISIKKYMHFKIGIA